MGKERAAKNTDAYGRSLQIKEDQSRVMQIQVSMHGEFMLLIPPSEI